MSGSGSPMWTPIFVTAKRSLAVSVQHNLAIEDGETKRRIVGNVPGEVQRIPLLCPIVIHHVLTFLLFRRGIYQNLLSSFCLICHGGTSSSRTAEETEFVGCACCCCCSLVELDLVSWSHFSEENRRSGCELKRGAQKRSSHGGGIFT